MARAQQLAGTPSATLRSTLDSLAEQSRVYLQTMPNFTCDESIRAEEKKKGKTRHLTETTGSFRVLKSLDGGWPVESRLVAVENGKPVKQGTNAKLPVVLKGGFGRVLPLYFDAARRSCFRYALEPGRVTFEAVPEVAALPACAGVAPQAKGFAALDAGTGAVTHVERTVPDTVAAKTGYAAFSAVDFATAQMNGQSLQVPQRIVGEIARGDSRYRFEAQYSSCHLFTGTARLLPDNAVQE